MLDTSRTTAKFRNSTPPARRGLDVALVTAKALGTERRLPGSQRSLGLKRVLQPHRRQVATAAGRTRGLKRGNHRSARENLDGRNGRRGGRGGLKHSKGLIRGRSGGIATTAARPVAMAAGRAPDGHQRARMCHASCMTPLKPTDASGRRWRGNSEGGLRSPPRLRQHAMAQR